MTAECAPVYEYHDVLRDVAADVLLDDALPVFLGSEVLILVQVVVKHFLGRAFAEAFHHEDPPWFPKSLEQGNDHRV